jgi:hypothetical protein
MKDRDMIVRLRGIRQMREQRAGEKVIQRQTAARKAAMRTTQAVEATAAHLERIGTKERSAFGSLIGQSVSAVSLHRIRGQVEKAAGETLRFREDEKLAGEAEKERKAELSEARGIHRARIKAVTKLDRLLEHMSSRGARRNMALAELSDEEDSGSGHKS